MDLAFSSVWRELEHVDRNRATHDASIQTLAVNEFEHDGFAVMFITGVLLFMTHAGKAYGNVFFRTKLMFLLLLGINAVVYQAIFYPKMAQWEAARRTPLGARLCAGLSLIVWIGVIICGRTMAYQF